MSATVASKGAIVGALACQKDSYLKSFTTRVLSCKPISQEPVKKSKSKGKSKNSEKESNIFDELYEVELEDTILFPEGGGQPSDVGFISMQPNSSKKITVADVQRRQLRAVHITREPVTENTHVLLELDWKKRFDYMQQHTGQHLLSAVLDRYNLPTLSWNMGEVINYVELPRKLSEEEINKFSAEVNEEITRNASIKIEVPTEEGSDVHDEKGVMRIVHIGELDSNPCCGTHLSSTGQIKAIALLNQVSGKGSNSRLNFIAGDRIIQYAKDMSEIVRSLGSTLSAQVDTLNDKATSLVTQSKKLSQRESALMKELAMLKAKELKEQLDDGKEVVYSYRPDADLDYIKMVFKELGTLKKGNIVLLTGELKHSGAVVIEGDKTAEIVDELKKILSGLKGGGKGRFQGKVTSYEKGELDEALHYLQNL